MQHDHDDAKRYHGDFDEKALTWDDDPAKVERASIVAAQIVEAVAPNATTRLLEYGAGTGLVAQALAPHVGPITLADPSQGMREAMARKVAAGTLPHGSRIWSTRLGEEPTPDERFDLVVSVQVLHHVESLQPLLAAFAEVTEAGGHLCICDLESEDGSFHGEGFGGHHGFDRDSLGAQITAAGFADVGFRHAYDLHKEGHDYPLFLAVATR